MNLFRFSKYNPDEGKSPFETLLNLFLQLLTYTNGDFNEAMQWMNELDKEYKLTNTEYGIGDFVDDLKAKGYIDDKNEKGETKKVGTRRQTVEKVFIPTRVLEKYWVRKNFHY